MAISLWRPDMITGILEVSYGAAESAVIPSVSSGRGATRGILDVPRGSLDRPRPVCRFTLFVHHEWFIRVVRLCLKYLAFNTYFPPPLIHTPNHPLIHVSLSLPMSSCRTRPRLTVRWEPQGDQSQPHGRGCAGTLPPCHVWEQH